MNLEKLYQASGIEEYRFLKDVAKRLESVFGSWISHDEAIALISILAMGHTVEWRDGFVINSADSISNTLGFVEAGAIASCICMDPDKDWSWWKLEMFNCDTAKPPYPELIERMLGKIISHPSVKSIS